MWSSLCRWSSGSRSWTSRRTTGHRDWFYSQLISCKASSSSEAHLTGPQSDPRLIGLTSPTAAACVQANGTVGVRASRRAGWGNRVVQWPSRPPRPVAGGVVNDVVSASVTRGQFCHPQYVRRLPNDAVSLSSRSPGFGNWLTLLGRTYAHGAVLWAGLAAALWGWTHGCIVGPDSQLCDGAGLTAATCGRTHSCTVGLVSQLHRAAGLTAVLWS